MEYLKRTWAEVDLDALAHNYHALKSHVHTGCRFLGVVKADAYGHGAVPVSRALAELGADYLAVSNFEEAVQLRRGGIALPILLLGYTPPRYAPELQRLQITQEVHSLEYAKQLDDALTAGTLTVHIKLNTGMTRLGFDEWEYAELLRLWELSHLHIEGMFTHFSAADSLAPADVAYTEAQYARYEKALTYLTEHGKRPALCHVCNSGATLLYPQYAMDMIRPGIATYGFAPSKDAEGAVELKPLMSLYTTVSQLRTIPAGTDVSYGRTYTAGSSRRLAVLTVGYADGLRRDLSGRMEFMIGNSRAPQVGRICMDMCMADVTDIPDVQAGDTVEIFGGGQSCGELADRLGTISYELLCDVSKRVPRIYRKNGRADEILQYIV